MSDKTANTTEQGRGPTTNACRSRGHTLHHEVDPCLLPPRLQWQRWLNQESGDLLHLYHLSLLSLACKSLAQRLPDLYLSTRGRPYGVAHLDLTHDTTTKGYNGWKPSYQLHTFWQKYGRHDNRVSGFSTPFPSRKWKAEIESGFRPHPALL